MAGNNIQYNTTPEDGTAMTVVTKALTKVGWHNTGCPWPCDDFSRTYSLLFSTMQFYLIIFFSFFLAFLCFRSVFVTPMSTSNPFFFNSFLRLFTFSRFFPLCFSQWTYQKCSVFFCCDGAWWRKAWWMGGTPFVRLPWFGWTVTGVGGLGVGVCGGRHPLQLLPCDETWHLSSYMMLDR